MTYHYGTYSAEILPVRSKADGSVRYWHYKIYEQDQFLFDGHDADLVSARVTAEAHIDKLIGDALRPIKAA